MNALGDLATRWPEISALLDEALELPAAQRASWLDALDGERAALTDTVRRLLEARANVETGNFLDTLPRLAHALEAADDAMAAKPGALVGPYRLISELGHGGMGAVWLAERADGSLKRQVALKLPHVSWAGGLAERMARERDILATLEHPNIARLYDAGVDSMGRPWLALEYVQGRTIDVFARERALDVRARLDLLLQVCSAVAYAHSRLVIHRDLKPSNILVTDEGHVRLLDFGIAKLMEGDRTNATALTQAAGRVLTPEYASPEQVRGESLTTASDVYSLGVICYEMLTGQRPYRLKRGTAAELEEAIASSDTPPASQDADTAALKKQLRGDLDAILNKALQKSLSQRYESVTSLAGDVRRHLNGEAVLARPDSTWDRLTRFTRRNRVPVLTSILVGAALSVAAVVALRQSREAVAQAQMARRAAERETAVSTLYLETLTTVAGWDAKTFAEPLSVAKVLRAKLDELEKRFDASNDRRLALLETVATQLPYMGDADSALAVGKRLIALLEKSGGTPDDVLTAHSQVGRTLIVSARYAEAEGVLAPAMVAPSALQARAVTRARALDGLGSALLWQGKRSAARRALDQAVELMSAAPDTSGKLLSETLQTLARTESGFDSLAALATTERAGAALRSDRDAGPDYLGASLLFLAAAQAEAGRPAAAEATLREALKLWEPLFGATDRDTVSAVGRLAHALAAQQRFDEARALLDERLTAVRSRPGPDTPYMLQTLHTRLRQLEVARGDVRAAAEGPPPSNAQVATKDPLDKFMADHDLLVSVGQHALALERVETRLAALSNDQRSSAVGFKLQLALTEAQYLAGAHRSALTTAQALLAQMKQEGAVATWSYTEATERAALAFAATGEPARGVALLQEEERLAADRRVPPPMRCTRADSAMRRAQVWLESGQPQQASKALSSLDDDLANQHPDSARLSRATRLLAAAGPRGAAK